MTAADTAKDLFTQDGVPLKVKLRRAERARKLWALSLVAPLFFFIVIAFILPIFSLLKLSVEDQELGEIMPETAAAFRAWDGEGFPPPEAMMTFARELVPATESRQVGTIGRRVNYVNSGLKSSVMKTGRAAEDDLVGVPADQILDAFIAVDKVWAEPDTWYALKTAASPYSEFYLLWAFDLERGTGNEIVDRPANESVYRDVLWNTIEISIVTTLLCLALGLPVAYLLCNTKPTTSNLLLIFVLLPFWTSLLVRTTAWVVLLQSQGLINELGQWVGLWSDPLELIRNRFGVYVAMVHIQLPFMVLPIYSVMKGINPWHMRAAESLGAPPWKAFLKVYLPQCTPGIGAGVLLVFILSLGYYITPALVGGPRDQMISYYIVENMNRLLNWGLAAALSVLLMAITLIFFFIFNRLVGFDKLRMG